MLDPSWVALPGPLLQVVTTWNSMLERIWVVLLGPPLSLIAGSSFRFYGWLPIAQLICWELYLVSSGCLRSATRVLFMEILSSVASADSHKLLEAFLESALNPISIAVDVQSAFHSSKLRELRPNTESSASALMDLFFVAAGSSVSFYSLYGRCLFRPLLSRAKQSECSSEPFCQLWR